MPKTRKPPKKPAKGKKPSPPKAVSVPRPDPGQQHRDEEAARRRATSASVRDIGPIPPIADIERRERCRASLREFCDTYNPEAFDMGWSGDQLESLARIEEAVTLGALYAFAEPRGDGKTTRSRMAALWAASNALCRYPFVINATDAKAADTLAALKIFFRFLPTFAADFPEISYPIRRLEGIANRASGQTCNGQPTMIEWTADRIVLPTVPPPPNWPARWPLRPDGMVPTSGVVISTSGLTGEGIRGSLKTLTTGEQVRPDLVLIDDPQTNESARSRTQNVTRENLISADVLGMAGPGKPIAAIMPCTVIAPGDCIDRLTDRTRHPLWRGRRSGILKSMPTNLAAWDLYFEVYRRCAMKEPPDFAEANDYYVAHRAELDEGAEASWEARKLPGEVSAIQHAMNLYARDRRAFMAEYMNRPEPIDLGERIDALDAEAIAKKLNYVPRGVVPQECTLLTAFIDVGAKLLHYVVCAWNDRFAGAVVDYGTFPKQTRSYYAADDARPSMADLWPNFTEDQRVYAALKELVPRVAGAIYPRQGGGELTMAKCLIDSGKWTKAVTQFIRQNPLAALLVPSKGYGIGPGKPPMANWPVRDGEPRPTNPHWRLRPNTEGGHGRLCIVDTNHWKTFAAALLQAPEAGPGCLQLFGDDPDAHRLFADHCTAEYSVRARRDEGDRRPVDVWSLRPEEPDNHWWDCYDEETEVLTRDGFRFFRDLTGDEELATVDLATDLIEYQRSSALIRRPYAGPMVQIGGERRSRVNLCVTPTHRMVIYAGQASRGPVIRAANELTIWDKIKTRATWRGDGRTTYTIPATRATTAASALCRHCNTKPARRSRGLCWGCYYQPGVKERYAKKDTRRGHPEVVVSASDLAAFMGWYVAEGSCRVNHAKGKGRTHVVVISQNPGAKMDAICALLDRLPWAYHVAKKGVVISNEQAYSLVRDLGNKYTKRVPQWVKDAGPDVIAEFVRCAVDGDGWRHGKHEAYATVSPQLADDMQELYLKIGFGVSCYTRAPVAYSIAGNSGTNTREQYHVHRKTAKWAYLSDHSGTPNFHTVDYDGEVFCATVPNGTLIVRRKGKVAVCGNCLVGCLVAGSVQGLVWDSGAAAGDPMRPKEPRVKRKLSELFAAKNGGR